MPPTPEPVPDAVHTAVLAAPVRTCLDPRLRSNDEIRVEVEEV